MNCDFLTVFLKELFATSRLAVLDMNRLLSSIEIFVSNFLPPFHVAIEFIGTVNSGTQLLLTADDFRSFTKKAVIHPTGSNSPAGQITAMYIFLKSKSARKPLRNESSQQTLNHSIFSSFMVLFRVFK